MVDARLPRAADPVESLLFAHPDGFVAAPGRALSIQRRGKRPNIQLWCMMTRYASPWIVPVASGNGTTHDLVEGQLGHPAIGNAAVLHVRMHRIPDRRFA